MPSREARYHRQFAVAAVSPCEAGSRRRCGRCRPRAQSGVIDALSVGTRIGLYQIVSAIGAGGMGEVSRTTDTKQLKREVAIKVLPVCAGR